MESRQLRPERATVVLMGVACAALTLWSISASAEEINTAAELSLPGLPMDTPILVLESDPTFEPVESADGEWLTDMQLRAGLGMGRSAEFVRLIPAPGREVRAGCPDEGFSNRAYARDSGNDWPWIPANTIVADDLTLEPGHWVVGCYDVLIYADNNPSYGCNTSRTVTLQAYDDCHGTLIPGSQESWTVPPHGGPVLLTGVTNIDFEASGTIWFALTTTINECDGWYLGQQQPEGSTTNVFQLDTDCAACINPPSCSPWAGFIVILYGCTLPEITSHPEDATECEGGWNQFCVIAEGTGSLGYQWQLNGEDVPGAESPCYVATLAGSYRCIVSNDCGSVISDSAVFTLRAGPNITAQPVGGVICTGHTHELCVAADAIGELHYQWKRNGLNVIGATSECYDATDPGSYTCVVTDDCGPTTSDAAPVVLASPVSGDFDGDGDADLDDFGVFADCLTGPAGGIGAGCECVDTDGDGRIDLVDFAGFQAVCGM